MSKIKWSSLFTKDDWWAVWIGFIILLFGVVKYLPPLPKLSAWSDITKSYPIEQVFPAIIVFLITFILSLISLWAMRKEIKYYLPSFVTIFSVTLVAFWLGKFVEFSKMGLETVLWALIIGLIISNIFRVPKWLKTGIQTELFIKIGLVILGAEILFSSLIKGGLVGIAQGFIVVLVVWFFAYWLARKFGMNKTFASTMASGLSICGVSAAIASGGAVKGDPKETSYVISLVLLVAMPMLIFMPLLSKALELSPAIGGAWMGGTIDTTGAVVAAGTLIDPKVGLTVASLVKMAQNVFIGFAAFFLAIWSMVGKKSENEKPSVLDIWYRFPKFILGFVLASLIMSFIVEPSLGSKDTSGIISITKGYREWFFALGFVCIGLETRFKDLISVGKGKPILVFCLAQLFNIIFTLGVAWLLWSGTLFPVPI